MIAVGYISSLVFAGLTPVIGKGLLVALYGVQYGDTWIALGIVVAVQGFWLHTGLLQTAFRASGVPHWAAVIEVLGVLVTIIVMVATASHGYFAAAIGTAASCIFTLAASM